MGVKEGPFVRLRLAMERTDAVSAILDRDPEVGNERVSAYSRRS